MVAAHTRAVLSTCLRAALLVAACRGDPAPPAAGDAPAPGDAGPLAPEVELCNAWMEAGLACMVLDPAARSAVQADCEDRRRDAAAHWTDVYIDAFVACVPTVDCADVDNIDDICFPEALIAVNAGDLPDAVLMICSNNSQGCLDAVNNGEVTGNSVAARCLRRWAECDALGQTSNPFWGEDPCITILALDPESRTQASACLDLTCTETQPCLSAAGAFGF